ncbi:MAG: hypothetical protein ACYCUF_12350 [Acidimicrobiales bacterium]
MTRRLRWLAAGALGGAAGALWARRRFEEARGELARRLAPSSVASGVANGVRCKVEGASARVRAAIIEGRDQARRREGELRANHDDRGQRVELGNPMSRVELGDPISKVDLGDPLAKAELGDPPARLGLGDPRAKVGSEP